MTSTDTDVPVRLLIARGLRVCETLREWPEEVLARIAEGSRLARYKRGAQALAHNPRQRDMLVVVSGAVELTGINAAGAKFLLGRMGAGRIVNLVRLIPGLESSYYCHAVQSTLLVHVPADHMRVVLDGHPVLWRDVAMLALARQQESILTLQRRGFGSRDQGLAQALVGMLRQQGEFQKDGTIRLRVSQADLASMLAVSRQTINKELRGLSDRGVLDVAYGELRILQMPVLERLAAIGSIEGDDE